MCYSISKLSQMSKTRQIGTWGEQLVAHWLRCQGWQILQHQYRTRWGEIDLIGMSPTQTTIIFVEVKTRSHRNWDSDGLLAVTSTKQEKLILSAQWFLAQHPEFADYCCKFDVALVRWQSNKSPTKTQMQPMNHFQYPIRIGEVVNSPMGDLILQQYIESAFWSC